MSAFFAVVLSIWTAMHAYVLWRAWPLVTGSVHPAVVISAMAILWAAYPLGRILDSSVFEYVGAQWLGVLFLLSCCLLAADLVTGFGWFVPRWTLAVRAGALGVAALLVVAGAVIAHRTPVVRPHDVRMAGLPRDLDGKVVVVVSDLHVGRILGARWLEARIDQVLAEKPDLVIVAGDLVDGNVGRVEPLIPALRRLRAPLGVWAVLGNHEVYAGTERSIALLRDAGFHVLVNEAAEAAPGLVVAGIEDLTARRQIGTADGLVRRALEHRPPGATIYLSHTPWQAGAAARLGAGVMISGHTHDGQIWPFYHFVRLQYPLIGGRYEVDGMPVFVCRGTGTWGPRLRLWMPSEILRLMLRTETS